ncbi:hypothetical protein [Streptomyces olivochromogenes]|uniref:hypothetical protein n=1 Tax=Streptomyces olivochromogenes TaxID=1963 RepID=UPI001F1A65ED|nr:hypothetical protein [Streptomyces olivochromogenes]
MQLGEPECTGECCGFLSVVVQRMGNVVQWSGWQVPHGDGRLPEFDFDANEYDAEVARAGADPGWRILA